MDPDPDPTIFVIDLHDSKKKFNKFFCLLLEGTFTYFLKIKSQNSRYLVAYWEKDPDPDPYLWLMDPDPHGPNTYLRIRRIRIRNTDNKALDRQIEHQTTKKITHQLDIFRIVINCGTTPGREPVPVPNT